MIMENVLLYLGSFVIYVFIQGLVINGLKACTEGHYDEMPDGNKIAKGMIFFKIANYLNQYTTIPVYYKDEGIKLLINQARDKFGNAVPVSFINGSINNGFLRIAAPDTQEHVMIQQFINTIVKKIDTGIICRKWTDDVYVFYKEYERHKFPKFIRKSVALNCIKCAASFWGTVTFLPVFFLFGICYWTILAWAFSMLSLVYVNYYLYKKL